MLLYLIYVARPFYRFQYCLFSLIDRHAYGRGTLLQNDHAVVVFEDTVVLSQLFLESVLYVAMPISFRPRVSILVYACAWKMGFACKQVMVTRVSLYTKINSIACNCVYAGKNTRV